ncbi:outer membrane protein assembly factor BamB family protein [Nocardioides dilutus]
MSRLRSVAAWVPAVVLVPVTLAASISVTRTDDPDAAMDQVSPLDPGTTWVYRVLDHGEPSGRHVRQVLGPAQLITDRGLTEMTRVSSVHDAYPGRGRQAVEIYLSVDGDELLQHGLILGGEKIDVTPAATAAKTPPTLGTTWSYDGMVGTVPYAYEAEVTDVGDVEVGGRTFSGCAETTSTIDLTDSDKGETEVLVEWTCPDIGIVKSRDVVERDGVDITEELVSFQGPEQKIVLGPVPDEIDPATPAAPAADAEDAPSTAGFDLRRSHAVPDGELGRELAWTESRDEFSGMSPVSDGRTVVLGEQDGLVSARDAANGELRWQVSLTPPIVATPTINDDQVLVADASKNLWALSLADGSAQWVHRFDDVVSATPVATGNLVVVAVEDGSVIALSPDDGEEQWSAEVGGLIRSAPAVEDDVLVVGDRSGTLTALDLDDGEQLWTAGLSNGLDFGPALGDDEVLAVDGDGVLVAYDLDDGDLTWQARGRSFPSEPVAVAEDLVVTVTVAARVEAFDMDDGELVWSRRLSDMEVAPAVVGDEVMVVGKRGRVTVLGLDDGTVRETWDLPAPTPDARLTVDTPIGLVGGDVVVTALAEAPDFAYTSYAYPIRREDDRPRGVAYTVEPYVFPQGLTAAPVLDGEAVYGLDYDSTLHRSTGLGAATLLQEGLGTTVGLAAGDGVVVVPKGDEVWGVRGATGERLWKVAATEAFFGTFPAVADGVAFVPIREVGLVAVDLETGKRRWAAPVVGTAGTSVPLPLAGGDVAYAGSTLTRYDGRTGDVVWQLGGDLADSVGYVPIAADQDAVYAQLTGFDATSPNLERTDVVAADLRTGEVLWRHQLASGAFAIGTAVDSRVVVAVDGQSLVTALDAETGEVLWTYRMASAAAGTPVASDNVVHLAERGRGEDLLQRDVRVVTLDLATGRFLGSYEPPSANDTVLPIVGAGPDGELLVPTTAEFGINVAVLEVSRD